MYNAVNQLVKINNSEILTSSKRFALARMDWLIRGVTQPIH